MKRRQLPSAHTEQDWLAAGEQRRPDFFESGLLFFERGLLFLSLLPKTSAQDEYHDDYRDRGYQTRWPINISRLHGLADLFRLRGNLRRNYFEGRRVRCGLPEDGNIGSRIQVDS